MRVVTEGKNIDVEFFAKVGRAKDKCPLKEKRDERGIAHAVVDDEGRNVYRTPLYAVVENEEGDQREEQNVSVAVANPIDFKMGVAYVLKGKVAIVHYVTQDNRMGVAITAESVAVKTATANASQDKQGA